MQTRSSTSSWRDLSCRIGDSLFIPGHLVIPSFIPGEVSYSHQWPRCGEHFFGRKTPEDQFLGRLLDLVPGRARSTRLRRSWTASFLQLSWFLDIQYGRRPFRAVEGSSFWQGSVDCQPSVWTSGSRQRVNNT